MMAVCRVSFFLCLLAVVVPLVVADGTARRKVPSVGDISEESLKEYMEEQQGKVEPPAKNASPLLLCIPLSLSPLLHLTVATSSTLLLHTTCVASVSWHCSHIATCSARGPMLFN